MAMDQQEQKMRTMAKEQEMLREELEMQRVIAAKTKTKKTKHVTEERKVYSRQKDYQDLLLLNNLQLSIVSVYCD